MSSESPKQSTSATLTSPTSNDIQHKSSNNAIGSDHHRAGAGTKKPQRLRTGETLLGAHSPSSIPSSPASIRSISSAIFERDIEPTSPPLLSPPSQHQNPHRIPRARSTEQLEHAVPSVLDSAASVLAAIEDVDVEVDVVAPANLDSLSPRGGSGFASPIGSLRSRSPSPIGVGAVQPVSPHVISSSGIPSASLHMPPSPAKSTTASSTSTSTSPAPTSPSSPQPSHAASAAVNKRLSFMSYSDLLSSTPASLHSLSSLTTSASSSDPPPHIPSVSGSLTPVGSRAPSIRGRKRDSVLVDDVGGEWEREGLGMGLEERLEGVVSAGVGGAGGMKEPKQVNEPPKA